MTPDLGSALVRAQIAIGRDPIEVMHRTDEVLLKIHQDEMRRIEERYDKLRAIRGLPPTAKNGEAKP